MGNGRQVRSCQCSSSLAESHCRDEAAAVADAANANLLLVFLDIELKYT
jgi:hypothetical protein